MRKIEIEAKDGRATAVHTLLVLFLLAGCAGASWHWQGARLPWVLPTWGALAACALLWPALLAFDAAARRKADAAEEGIAEDSDAAFSRLDEVAEMLRLHADGTDPKLTEALSKTEASCSGIRRLLERSPEAFSRGAGLFDYAIPKILSVLPAYAALAAKTSLSDSQKTRLDAARGTLLRLPALFDAHLQTMQEDDVQRVVERIRALEAISMTIEHPSLVREEAK